MLELIEGRSPAMALLMLTAALITIGLACLLMAGMAVVIVDFIRALGPCDLNGQRCLRGSHVLILRGEDVALGHVRFERTTEAWLRLKRWRNQRLGPSDTTERRSTVSGGQSAVADPVVSDYW